MLVSKDLCARSVDPFDAATVFVGLSHVGHSGHVRIFRRSCRARGTSPVKAPPLALRYTWPLFEAPRKFDLGLVLCSGVIDAIDPSEVGALGVHHVG